MPRKTKDVPKKKKNYQGSPVIDIKAPGPPKRRLDKVLVKITAIDISTVPDMRIRVLVTLEGPELLQDICNQLADKFTKDQESRIGTTFGGELLRRFATVFGTLKAAQGRYIYAIYEKSEPVGFQTISMDGPVNGFLWEDVKSYVTENEEKKNEQEG